jgi:hypothetical protein
MKKEQTFGIIRHTLTFIGGLLFYNGVLDENETTEIVSATMTLVGLVWSILEKNKK